MNGTAILTRKAETGHIRPVAFKYGSSINQTFTRRRSATESTDKGIQLAKQWANQFVIIVTPGIRRDNAAAGVFAYLWRERKLIMIGCKDDDGTQRR
jgi:hypothetical protein